MLFMSLLLVITVFVLVEMFAPELLRQVKMRLLRRLYQPKFLPPPVLAHLTSQEWREHESAWADWTYGTGKYKNNNLTIFQWIESEELPPVPPEQYDPVTERWVHQMPLNQKTEYFQTLRKSINPKSID